MSIYIIIDKKNNEHIFKSHNLYRILYAKDYISNVSILNEEKTLIVNLCSSYRYQSIGYYVSLLAIARNHKPLPEVLQIQDFTSIKVIRKIMNQLSSLIEKSLCSISGNHFELSIYFGKNITTKYMELAKELFQLLPMPLFKVYFVKKNISKRKKNTWVIQNIEQLSLEDIPKEHYDFFNESLNEYLQLKKKYKSKYSRTHYDLAILTNPEEKYPPSNPKTINKFVEIGKKIGFNVQIIFPEEINRLGEFDALFIRETTYVNHHTYHFSRLAEAMGLIVVDDPNSILKCSNKVFLTELLRRNKIRIPNTFILFKNNYKQILEKISFPCVLKKPDSAFSMGVIKVSHKEEFIYQIRELFKFSEIVIAQEFIYTDYDWRIGILDGSPLYACKYFMAKNHWQVINWNSIKNRDGNTESVPLQNVPDSIIKTALKASSLIGRGLYGVDLKEIHNKIYVIEINDNPNIDYGFEDKYLKNKLYEKIIKYFYNRIQKSKNF
ncbi:MAG: RimK family protein [Leptonema sp. (in: bacteria)]